MKNVYFAAALAVLAFSACSDDKDGDSVKEGACYSKIGMFDGTEMEGSASCTAGISQSVTVADCDEAQEYLDMYAPDYETVVTYMKSCPAGYKFKCEEKNGKVSFYNYYYGPAVEGKSCKDM
jgi:hypothetical protein